MGKLEYSKVMVHTASLNAYDAIVDTGLNTKLLGIQDNETKAVVINAKGLTPSEVAKKHEINY